MITEPEYGLKVAGFRESRWGYAIISVTHMNKQDNKSAIFQFIHERVWGAFQVNYAFKGEFENTIFYFRLQINEFPKKMSQK